MKHPYSRVAHHVSEALYAHRIPGRELQVCLYVIRNTYGVKGRDRAPVSSRKMAEALGLDDADARKSLRKLEQNRVLIQFEPADFNSPAIYGFNDNFEEWGYSLRGKVVASGGRGSCAPGGAEAPGAQEPQGPTDPLGRGTGTPWGGAQVPLPPPPQSPTPKGSPDALLKKDLKKEEEEKEPAPDFGSMSPEERVKYALRPLRLILSGKEEARVREFCSLPFPETRRLKALAARVREAKAFADRTGRVAWALMCAADDLVAAQQLPSRRPALPEPPPGWREAREAQKGKRRRDGPARDSPPPDSQDSDPDSKGATA